MSPLRNKRVKSWLSITLLGLVVCFQIVCNKKKGGQGQTKQKVHTDSSSPTKSSNNKAKGKKNSSDGSNKNKVDKKKAGKAGNDKTSEDKTSTKKRKDHQASADTTQSEGVNDDTTQSEEVNDDTAQDEGVSDDTAQDGEASDNVENRKPEFSIKEVKLGQKPNNFLEVSLNTGNSEASLNDFFVTARSSCGRGSLQGKPWGGDKYTIKLENTCITSLALTGREPPKFIIHYKPESGATVGEERKISVTITQKGEQKVTIKIKGPKGS